MFSLTPIAKPEAVGQRVKALREYYGLTQVDFAERCGVSRQQLANWEQGTKRPSLDAAVRMCEIYGATLDYLFLARTYTLPADMQRALTPPPNLNATSAQPV